VFALADAIHPRYRALVLLAVFCSLRWGELTALRRSDIDLAAGTVKITHSMTEPSEGGRVFYLHGSDERQRALADAVSEQAR
jgi:integrase